MLRLLALSILLGAGCAASRAEAPATAESPLAPFEVEPVAGRMNQYDAIVSFDQQARALTDDPDAQAQALRTLAVALEQMREKGDAGRIRLEADRVAAGESARSLKNALTHALDGADNIALKQGGAAAGIAVARDAVRKIDDGAPAAAQGTTVQNAMQRVAEVYVGLIQGR